MSNQLEQRIDEMIAKRLTLILTESDVRRVLQVPHCIDMQGEAYRAFSSGEAIVPPRPRIREDKFDGTSSYMPAYVPSVGGLGCKIVAGYLHNRERGLPSVMGSLVLLDHRTGFPIAYMASTYLTNARTGAGAACAGRALIRAGARSVGVFGSGDLARTTLTALRHVMQIDTVTVWSRSAQNREEYAAEMRTKLGLDVRAADDSASVAASDVIVAATTSRQPVFDGHYVRPGATLLSVGSGRPDMAEFPASVIKGNKFVVESRTAAVREYGELVVPMAAGELTEDAIYGEIGDILLGKIPGRTSDQEIIAFKSAGLAAMDMITARAIYAAALEQGVGQAIAMQGGSE